MSRRHLLQHWDLSSPRTPQAQKMEPSSLRRSARPVTAQPAWVTASKGFSSTSPLLPLDYLRSRVPLPRHTGTQLSPRATSHASCLRLPASTTRNAGMWLPMQWPCTPHKKRSQEEKSCLKPTVPVAPQISSRIRRRCLPWAAWNWHASSNRETIRYLHWAQGWARRRFGQLRLICEPYPLICPPLSLRLSPVGHPSPFPLQRLQQACP